LFCGSKAAADAVAFSAIDLIWMLFGAETTCFGANDETRLHAMGS
jgi:hypothetical protein